jgi:SAM-dependent methyltransferase
MPIALADDRPPIPPADLVLRVVTSFEASNIEGAQLGFDLGGLDHLLAFERGLAAVGRSFEQAERMLDFGCGCGRFIRHLGSVAATVEIHGTDIDAEMIGWCEGNIPYAQFTIGPHEPPLPYPDHHFDLIINHSVFTHLDERHQDLWLAELQRITRPDGTLLLTVEGASTWNRTVEASARVGESTEAWRAELESRGIVFIADDSFVGSTHPDFYHSTIHAPWYIFEHWSRFFEIAAYIPDGSVTQDLIVLKRRPDDAPAPPVIGRRASATGAARIAPARDRSGRILDRLAERIAVALRQRIDAAGPDEATRRELSMLRAGLYEQGNRISVIAAELRKELEALRSPGDDS